MGDFEKDPTWRPDGAEDEQKAKKIKLSPEEEMSKPPTDLAEVSLDPTYLAHAPLKMAAFNIQVLGRSKIHKTDITDILIKILCRYDIVVITELRDKTDTTIDLLLLELNNVDPANPFSVVESERLGRTNSKEQYVIIYRARLLSVKDTYQYDDGEDNGKDAFQREPFAVRFYSPTTEVTDFAIIAIHTDPEDAVKEINALYKVVEVTKKHWNMENIMIAGDFNADEGYVKKDDWSKIALHTDRRFKWLIDDETDTTVKGTDRAYDRFVVTGKELVSSVVPGSAKAYKFDKAMGLTDEMAESVSDHYPIEMKLQGKVNREVQKNVTSNMSFSVKQQTEAPSRPIIQQLRNAEFGPNTAHFECKTHVDKANSFEALLSRESVDDVIPALLDFRSKFPDVLKEGTIATVRGFMESVNINQTPQIYGLVKNEGTTFDIKLDVSWNKTSLECGLAVSKKMS